MDRNSPSVERAVATFESGFNCSQSICATYGPRYGLDKETCLRIASPFGAGLGYQQEICGAVTGSCMVIGLKHGYIDAADALSKGTTYGLVGELVKQFKSRHGSIICRDLLGVDIATDEGLMKALETNIFRTVCPRFVRDAAEILEGILKE